MLAFNYGGSLPAVPLCLTLVRHSLDKAVCELKQDDPSPRSAQRTRRTKETNKQPEGKETQRSVTPSLPLSRRLAPYLTPARPPTHTGRPSGHVSGRQQRTGPPWSVYNAGVVRRRRLWTEPSGPPRVQARMVGLSMVFGGVMVN